MADFQLKHFTIPADGPADIQETLNRFLRGHQVLSIRQEFVADGPDSRWCIAVRYAQPNRDHSAQQTRSSRSAVDYKDELEPEAFARFVELRSRRLKLANAEGLPAFAVFTDAELASIAELDNPKPEDLKRIKGLTKKKLERFADRILAPDDVTNQQETEHEAGGKTP